MDSIILKYNQLPAFEKKEVSDFIDFLFSRSKKEDEPQNQEHKPRVFPDAVWSEEDLKVFEENSKYFKQWEPPTW